MTTFTNHARDKIRTELERLGITERVVEEILENPDDLLYDTLTARFVAISWGRNVAVTYERSGREETVITVIYSSRLRDVVRRRRRAGRWI